MTILELFCLVDDFWQQFGPEWEHTLLASGAKHRRRAGNLHPSEILTLLIHFHQSHFRDFTWYYTHYVQIFLRAEFPHLVSYQRFVELMPAYLVPLVAFLQTQFGASTGISFIDSTALAVCKNPRIRSHRVFAGVARRGKAPVGWFYGFKLHLVINDCVELLAFCLTPGNVDDRHPVPRLAKRLFGKRFGDRGYLSQDLAQRLFIDQGCA